MRRNTHNGFSLLETIIAIAIFAMLSLALYLVITLAIAIVRDDQARLDGLALAQAKIEELRNVPYDDVGTSGGVPSGAFAQLEQEVHNDVTFTVDTNIYYVDDPFDGVAPADTVNTDYKKVEVTVTWENQFLERPVQLITTIAPEGLETNAGGGTLWVEVYNAEADPVANATVRITNTETNPAIDVTGSTDSDGRYILPGTPAAVQSYHIEISKNGLSSEQTYVVDAENNPNPDPGDLTVIESEITTKIFYIDTLSTMNITVQNRSDSSPIASTDITVSGSKRIGTDLDENDIPKYDAVHTTDAAGIVQLENIEYDSYSITLNDAAYDFAGSTPHLPNILAPGETDNVTILAAPNAAQTLLITVEDIDETPIENASVQITNGGVIDITQNTNTSGQTFFTPLIVGSFTVNVTAPGYDAYTGPVDVFTDEQQVIPLSPSI